MGRKGSLVHEYELYSKKHKKLSSYNGINGHMKKDHEGFDCKLTLESERNKGKSKYITINFRKFI